MCTVSLSAQTAKQAEKYFNDGDFDKSKAAYQRLVKTAPSNAGYNFFLGASLYELGEIKEAQTYLEKSAQRKYINAYRYLGKLYADLYMFDKAIDNYETHIEWLNEKNRDTQKAEEELSLIRQHARTFKGTEKVAVIDTFIVNKNDFLSVYKISKEAGTITTIPNTNGTQFENEMNNKRIYADTNQNKIQLYTQVKLLDGWSVGEPINSLNELGDVNYPFVMGDGTTLYFASDNEDTMGGYDIYITRYDSEENEYLRPSNLGMPFNSTANDYMMVIDEYNNLGWFASDRNQPEDSVCIYVFIPNETKRTYNYENTDLQQMIKAATLNDISATWENLDEINEAKKRLADIMNNKIEQNNEKNFTFIINDKITYHTLENFHSTEAQKLFTKLTDKQKELEKIENELVKMRDQYAVGNAELKRKLTPTILQLEKQIPQLIRENEDLTIQIRDLEITKINKK